MADKHPTPRADALRAQREARYGHLQATAEKPKPAAQKPAKPPRKRVKRKRRIE